MKSLQNKIFFFFIILLLFVQSIVFVSDFRTTKQQEKQQIASLLSGAKNNFKQQFEQRSYYLAAFADTAARDFGLKQVFEEDTRSLLVALNNHRKRIDADMVIAIDKSGKITGQLINGLQGDGEYKVKIGGEQGTLFRYMDWFEFDGSNHLYPLDGKFYQLNFSPMKSGNLVIGWVGFGYVIDQRLANRLSELIDLTVDFVVKKNSEWLVFASSTGGAQESEMGLAKGLLVKQNPDVVIATTYTFGEVESQELMAVIYGIRADLLFAIQRRWQELLLLAAIMLLISLVGAYLIAAGISRPVKLLVEQAKEIRSGEYTGSVRVGSKDELGVLAKEFNAMKQAVLNRENTIKHQAFHDQLTTLPNRYSLLNAIDDLIAHNPETFALIRLGPDRMREVNYSLGHDVGDEVVKEMARRLRRFDRTAGVFNVGGGSFALLLKSVCKSNIQPSLDKLGQLFESEFVLKNIVLNIQIRQGVAFFPEHSEQSRQLLAKAGTALQYATKNKLPQVVYQPRFSSMTIERLHLINGLKSAIAEQQMVLHYQPKLDFSRGQIAEVEALVRWQHPEQGMVPPDKFIGLAEQTGYIHQLTYWVIDTALKQHKRWQKNNIYMPIAINISAESLKLADFYETVVAALERYKLNPDAICLEITESVVVEDPDTTIKLLARFRDKGFRLSVDDYGTGYSSLAQLTQLPVSEMKIDKAFVTHLIDNEEDRVVVKSTIDLAHALGLEVVAEGIEDQQTLDWLKENGCEMAQGYFISKPKNVDEFNDWLLNSEYFKPKFDLQQVET